MRYCYWPGVFHDVAEHCTCCEACQESARRRASEKGKLVPMPIVGVPFRKVAIDMVAPPPRTKRGNKYVLVLVGYATRYPEAAAVPTLEAVRVAEELVNISSRTGLPDELMSDQGSNFMLQLMKELCQMLQIKKLTTNPYHAQGNGQIETFNGTLKAMLRHFVASEPET